MEDECGVTISLLHLPPGCRVSCHAANSQRKLALKLPEPPAGGAPLPQFFIFGDADKVGPTPPRPPKHVVQGRACVHACMRVVHERGYASTCMHT